METTEDYHDHDDSIELDPPRHDRKGKKREQIASGHALGTMDSCVVGLDFPPVSQCFQSFPWAQTPVGTPAEWPVELHIAFSIIHNSHIPAALYIDATAQLTFWNDQYAQTIVRSKHPTLYGAAGGKVYPEVEGIAEMIGGVFREGISYTQSAFQCFLRRIGTQFEEESFFDFTMGPLLDPLGNVYAVLNFANDRTQQNLLARRIEILSTLAARGARASSVEGVCHSFCRATKDSVDLPWMSIYVAAEVVDSRADKELTDELILNVSPVKKGKTKLFRLVSTTFDEGLVKVENDADLATDSNSSHENAFVAGASNRVFPSWLPHLPATTQFHTVLRQRAESSTVPSSPSASSSSGSTYENLEPSWPFLSLSTTTPYIVLSTPSPENPTGESIILPITTQSLVTGDLTVLGIIVAGLNPNRMIDHEYLAFYRNVTRQLESGIINGRARGSDRRTAEALRRLNHQRVQFFQNTAHELRTPLTLMLGPLEELVRDHNKTNATPVPSRSLHSAAFDLPPVAQTLSRLSLISRNARRLLKLVNSILRFSSIEAGKLDTKFTRQKHFGRVTRSLCECFESLAAQSGIELRFERGLVGIGSHDGTETDRATTVLDQQSENAVKEEVFVDMELWEQILFNLISNAFKHTWAGSITCSMYDDFEDGQDGVRFDLIDTGVGIGEMHRDSVFERFYRADNSDSRTSEGTGIGLSLTKELVKLHGGTVAVATTELGVGSTFSVFIPRGLDHLPREKIVEEMDPRLAELNAFEKAQTRGADEMDSIGDLGRSAMERWNSRTKGVERTSILEQVDFWVNEPARGPTREVEMDDAMIAPDSPYTVLTPTSVARIATAKTSYFPLVSDMLANAALSTSRKMETVAESTIAPLSPPPLKTGAGMKRKLSDVTVSYRNASAKRDPLNSIPVTSWYSPAKPLPSPNPTLVSSSRVEEPVAEGARPRLRGLPSIDPSDRPVVLMCDDNPDMRLWISSLLQTDYNVIEARNGGDALDILATVIPDLVLSDVMMPIIDGLALLQRIRNDPRLAQIPVILLSARSGEEDSLEGLESGADDYVVKPFSPRDLLARCRVHIRLSRMRRQTAAYESECVRLQERADAKDSLLGLVSHELRTPLASIFGALGLLKSESGSSPSGADTPRGRSSDLIETISKGADTLRGRIDQLLDVAKVDSDSFVLSAERFELDSVIASALGRHSITATNKGVQVFSIIGGPEIVVSDRSRLLQVLDSLLSNAAKFTERGEIVLRCWTENEAGEELEVYGMQESYLCFSVSDTGPGIPEELSSQIFLPFQLADATSTREHGGAGLGLALALRVVERAGGQIGVESTVGIGSKFSFRWPMQMIASEAEINTTNFEPVILVVSARPSLFQSIACTASSAAFDILDIANTLESAMEIVDNYDGLQPLVIFVDDHLVKAFRTETQTLLDRIESHSATASPRSKIYAICTAPIDSPRTDFHGTVSSPFHRKQVLAVISDILSKRNRYSMESTTPSEPDSLVCTGDPFPRGRLLIAEDNKINAKLLIRQLRTLGYAADEAEHGLRVLDLIHAEGTPTPPTPGSPPLLPKPYRGILMDLDMPTMDGFEATRRVRSMGGRFESLPIMAVTANASMGDKAKCIGAGMDDFVSKPISIAQLTALLKRNGLYSIASD